MNSRIDCYTTVFVDMGSDLQPYVTSGVARGVPRNLAYRCPTLGSTCTSPPPALLDWVIYQFSAPQLAP
jgi:hypothetical protein